MDSRAENVHDPHLRICFALAFIRFEPASTHKRVYVMFAVGKYSKSLEITNLSYRSGVTQSILWTTGGHRGQVFRMHDSCELGGGAKATCVRVRVLS